MTPTLILLHVRSLIGLIIMVGGVIGNITGDFDLVAMLVIIISGLVLTESATIHIHLKEIELKIQ